MKEVNQKKLKTALRESENLYRTIFETTGTAMIIVEEDTTISLANTEFERLSGYTREEVEGKKSWKEFITEGELYDLKKYHKLRRINPDAVPKRYECQFINRHNKVNNVLVSVDIIPDTSQSVVSLLNISNLKKAKMLVQKTQDNYRMLVENINDIIYSLDRQGYITYISPVVQQLFSYKLDEMIGAHFTSFIHPGDLDVVIASFENTMAGKADTIEFRIFDKDGTTRYLRASNRPKTNDNAPGLTGILMDITERKQVEEKLKHSLDKLESVVKQSIQAMAKMTETRDPYTAEHQRRVSKLAYAIATEMSLPEEDLEVIRLSGIIHDIGKIYVPAEILTKPGRISKSEFDLIKSHPLVGYETLKTIEFPWPIAQIVYQHHERMDGSGYPLALSGKDILLEARILAVADVVEAIASHRPYRPSLGIDKALEEIAQNRGTIYDSNVVDACIRLFTNKGLTL
jgi:PAS domain S-box-containing protein/putative nucleotidyltransferase with HDIG domain